MKGSEKERCRNQTRNGMVRRKARPEALPLPCMFACRKRQRSESPDAQCSTPVHSGHQRQRGDRCCAGAWKRRGRHRSPVSQPQKQGARISLGERVGRLLHFPKEVVIACFQRALRCGGSCGGDPVSGTPRCSGCGQPAFPCDVHQDVQREQSERGRAQFPLLGRSLTARLYSCTPDGLCLAMLT
eukprot:764262-Hanusia_phi.AAC.9